MGRPDGSLAILVAACAVLASACGARSWLGNANDGAGDASAGDAGVTGASDDAESGASDAALEGARPALPFALDVVGGGFHTCARLTDGTVRCWGDNALGQLGNGTHTGAQNPTPVSNLSGVTALASGPNHTCAVVAGGAVMCWGDNTYGQLGDGSLRSSNVPVAVLHLRGAVALALGDRHTCAVKSDGSAVCWGDNYYGQIGTGMSFCCTCGPPPDGGVCSPGYALDNGCASQGTQGCRLVSSEDSVTPTPVAGSHGLTLVSAGVAHTCGLISGDGTVLCWGSNDHGQLGNGRRANSGASTLGTIDPGPALVPNLAGATALAAGAEHVCALLSDGAVVCWGSNSSGQLGNGTVTDSLVPVAVPQLGGVKGLVSASGHTCAVLAGGAVECWGTNDAYQLGNNMTNPAACGGLACSSTPVPVLGLRNAIALGGGSEHTCAVLSDGTVWCWGLNAYGQLGNGTLADTSTPEAVRW